MKVEVLVATMKQSSFDLARKMNIQTDAIIINQTDSISYEYILFNDKKIRFFSFDERGVGLSRNSALMRSEGDICLMADDDMVYDHNYEKAVIEAFNANPKADVILFDVSVEDSRGVVKNKIKKSKKIGFHNYMKFGTVNIAFRRNKILKENLYFSLLFGGGAKYGSGEDTLFLTECLKKGIKIYAHPKIIAHIKYRPSSWFEGYTEKFFLDKGALFAAISPKISYLIAAQFLFRKKSIVENLGKKKVWGLLCRGIKEFSEGNQ
ncbi:glycosyltransferase family 2 protein [Exiguobacterium sp. SL-10]|uniref:glycosyltransferase family A protein n=1 Tax=Exiguobacterium sp. SL-10 TaxID=2510962 RepID=UPI001038BC09|nr:glycosyltransferase family A protein [Exiguobacterium sp. SL-10]TCI29645.1 glycosyltransferase family 2 protein [Exiguobacterium sp. SL-10]